MTILEAIIIAIVEGLTEFLPVSSTGHMILTSAAFGLENDSFVKTFEISIQLGAILAIVMIYAKRFIRNFKMYRKILVAFVPTAVVGLFAYKFIKDVLFNSVIVSVSLIVGGIILILIDRRVNGQVSKYSEVEDISERNAFFIGLAQCVSMIPGVSRAGATIVGGVFNGLNKKQATEFSFLLAVPTMFAAAGYDIYKTPFNFSHHELVLLFWGLIVAFISAWGAVKVFLLIIEKYGFVHFGWYRIAIGVLFLSLWHFGII